MAVVRSRALINGAYGIDEREYGIDERENLLKRKYQHSDATANQTTWRDIEEEEFDWNSLVRHGLTYAVPLASDSTDVGFLNSFDPVKKLKVRHESTISALYKDLPRQCTTCGLRFKFQQEHSKHMDWHVQKNRNRKTKPSPKWFVNDGAVGVESGPAFLLPVEIKTEDKTDEKIVVIANDDQKSCALCGDRFEDFFCDETEAWMYKGAVYMNAPAGSAAVIDDSSQLGPIVHAKCRYSVSDELIL